MEFILECILALFMAGPGAIVRKFLFRRKGTLKEIYKEDLFKNSIVGGMFMTIAFGGV